VNDNVTLNGATRATFTTGNEATGAAFTTRNEGTRATFEGIKAVFGQYIRSVLEGAAITMEFPVYALHDCVMMLEIRAEAVETLVRDLFGIQIVTVGEVRHLVLGNGVKLTSNTSNPEITLKGVKDDVVVARFGADILAAIKTSGMRQQELAADNKNNATECVSMIFTSKSGEGAYVNLCLGLEIGIEIWRKLYEVV